MWCQEKDIYDALRPLFYLSKITDLGCLRFVDKNGLRKYALWPKSIWIILFGDLVLIGSFVLVAWMFLANSEITINSIPWINIVQIVATYFNSIFVISSSISRQNLITSAIEKLDQIDKEIISIDKGWDSYKSTKKIVQLISVSTIGFIIFTILQNVWYIFTSTENYEYSFFILFVMSITIVLMTINQFVTYLQVVKQRFEKLNEILRNLYMNTAESITGSKTNTSKNIEDDIDKVASIHGMLCDVCEKINDSFGIVIILRMGALLVILIWSLFNTYRDTVRCVTDNDCDHILNDLSNKISWIIAVCIEIHVVILSCHFTAKEANATLTEVNNFSNICDDPSTVLSSCPLLNKIEKIHNKWTGEDDITPFYDSIFRYFSLIKLFALQLNHSEVHFNANGFFSLDVTLLQKIVGTVVTYLIILIQFQTT